jgi:spoIIIJ-associated protein
VAHAEASARTVDAAVTAAADQLGLRPDQVDIEVLEDPVPSTFGYIGTPARVRVTPRSESSPDAPPAAPSAGSPAPVGGAEPAGSVGAGDSTPPVQAAGSSSPSRPAESSAPVGSASSMPEGSATIGESVTLGASQSEVAADLEALAPITTDTASADAAMGAADATTGTTGAAAAAATTVDGVLQPSAAVDAPDASPAEAAQASDAATGSGSDSGAEPSAGLLPPSSSGPAWAPTPTTDLDAGSASISTTGPGPGSGPASERTMDASSIVEAQQDQQNESNLTQTSDAPNRSDGPSLSGGDSGSAVGVSPATDSVPNAASEEPSPSTDAADTTAVAAAPTGPSAPSAQPSVRLASAGNGERATDDEAVGAPSTLTQSPSSASSTPRGPAGSGPSSARPSRRTYHDEPIEPAMVEADTERAGDFLEGLLDALDVDGDITTWVDEVGGHIDLEGADLDVLVGSNGETLDALQELTRLAVLRQSKRRVRLLLDINGFRARQREQLIAIVKATAEQVIRTREDHEFQPMTPAERKIVHDAVAAIEGAETESLGEDPHRRVVIRPA